MKIPDFVVLGTHFVTQCNAMHSNDNRIAMSSFVCVFFCVIDICFFFCFSHFQRICIVKCSKRVWELANELTSQWAVYLSVIYRCVIESMECDLAEKNNNRERVRAEKTKQINWNYTTIGMWKLVYMMTAVKNIRVPTIFYEIFESINNCIHQYCNFVETLHFKSSICCLEVFFRAIGDDSFQFCVE